MKPRHNQADAPAPGQGEGAPTDSDSIDKQLTQLRSEISDLGFEMDSHKAGTAASMGAGVFMLLLAGVAGYDLWTGKAGIWAPLSVTRDLLVFIAWGLGATGVALLIQGFIRQRRRDREPEARLEELEQKYSRLLDRKESMSQQQP